MGPGPATGGSWGHKSSGQLPGRGEHGAGDWRETDEGGMGQADRHLLTLITARKPDVPQDGDKKALESQSNLFPLQAASLPAAHTPQTSQLLPQEGPTRPALSTTPTSAGWSLRPREATPLGHCVPAHPATSNHRSGCNGAPPEPLAGTGQSDKQLACEEDGLSNLDATAP